MKLGTGKERAGNCKLPWWVLKLGFQAISICQQPLLSCKDSFSVANTISLLDGGPWRAAPRVPSQPCTVINNAQKQKVCNSLQ